jgi:hypothetical protein
MTGVGLITSRKEDVVEVEGQVESAVGQRELFGQESQPVEDYSSESEQGRGQEGGGRVGLFEALVVHVQTDVAEVGEDGHTQVFGFQRSEEVDEF